MPQIATKVTRGTLDVDVTVENGDSIRVHSIILANNTGGDVKVDFKIGDGTGDPILTMWIKDGENSIFEGIWIADQGLSVDNIADANAYANIIHSAGGV